MIPRNVRRFPLDLTSAGDYSSQLARKTKVVWGELGRVLDDAPRAVYPSRPTKFRHKCGFGVWRGKSGAVGYSMPNAVGEPTQIHGHFAVPTSIATAMRGLLGPLNDDREFHRGLCTYTFYSTSDGDVLVALGFNSRIKPSWLACFAVPAADRLGMTIVGRGPRGQRVVAGGPGHIVQWFEINGRRYPQFRRDGIFVQTNIGVCGDMLRWADDWASSAFAQKPLPRVTEPYCGNGNFTLPLARYFGHVVASDTAAAAIEAARTCAAIAHVDNASFSHYAATRAIESARPGGVLLLNPPREGCEPGVIEAACEASHVLYVSCNPATLARDLKRLRRGGHRVARAAFFDQFPYSDHAEVGVALHRR